MKRNFILIAVFYLLVSFAYGANDQAGTSGAAFLKLGQSVRAASLGGSFAALADDPSAIFYNPAGLQLSGYSRLAFTQTNWLVNSSYSTICYSAPLGLYDSFGAAVSNISFGNLQETTSNSRTGTGREFSPGSILGIFSWARSLPQAYVGASVKFIRQNIDTFQTDGLGLDFGVLTRTSVENLRLGISLLNLGTTGGQSLPRVILVGLDYEAGFGATFVGDVRLPGDDDLTVHLGLEYKPLPLLALRAGFNTRSVEGAGGAFSAGLGLNFSDFNIDYAYVPYADLGETHRVGIMLKF